MSNKYTKIIAAFGMAAGLGVASLPVAGVFAADSASTEVQLGVTIKSDIALAVGASDKTTVEMAKSQVLKEAMVSNLTVTTNNTTGYKLDIKAGAAGTDLVSGENKIAATSGELNTTSGGWNYTVKDAYGLDNKEITAADATIKTTDAATAASGDTTTVYYNVATKENQAKGIYTGTVVYTATANAAS